MSKGRIILFMGIAPPKSGEFWTTNRHSCMGKAQIRVTLHPDESFETYCPTCKENPTVIYEAGRFYFFSEVIL